MGIRTALDLANAPTSLIRNTFGVVLERTQRELNGESCIAPEEVRKVKQQIISSRSFGQKIEHYEAMHRAVCEYAERAGEKLREEKQYCRCITVLLAQVTIRKRPLTVASRQSSWKTPPPIPGKSLRLRSQGSGISGRRDTDTIKPE